jgi:probable HAF family extracellular repeat protein
VYLDTLGGDSSSAFGVSVDGLVVVGQSATLGNTEQHAFRWTSATGMVDLGTLGGTISQALGTNGDGSVVVGLSNLLGNTATHAFRWTSATGMVDLGTLGGTSSVASATNIVGSVVVGESFITGDLFFRAFRWTSVTGMADLGTLGGSNSAAYGTNSDGGVIVGQADTIGGETHAFRWTALTGMIDLGTLPGGGNSSTAYGTNADGSVVVGQSAIAGKEFRAFRWTLATGMVDLGVLSKGTQSAAYATNSDGSVVVGQSAISGLKGSVAFRWTNATGMKDLNILLSDAGVDMKGIILTNATGVSADGQFIVGSASLKAGERAYIVRYYDGTPAGLTTPAAVQSSIDDLADTRLGLMAQHHGFAAPLLGADKPMESGNEAGVFASAGSAAGGGFMRYGFGQGFSVLAGLSYAKENYPDADLDHAFTGALALRYLYSSAGWWHPFVEGGGWLAPNASLDFSRQYANGAGVATGTGYTSGDLTYLYARAGILVAPTRDDQVALSAEVGRERMSVDGYTEAVAGNPFEAHVAPGTDTADLAKLRLQWSHRFTSTLDTTLWIAGVRAFNRESGLVAMVPGIGTLTPSALGDFNWAEYGARVGYKLTDATTLDLFVNGVSGSDGVDTRVHGGVGLRFRF